MKRTVYLSAGHSNEIGRDRGTAATHSGVMYIEGHEAVRMRDRISASLQQAGITVVTDENRNVLAETIRFFRNKTTSRCIVVDIHFNAASPTANGTEVLVPEVPTTKERGIATDICNGIVAIGFRNRGVKTELQSHHGRLGWMRLTGENVLIETCFISNKDDMDRYVRHFNQVCDAISSALIKHATS